MTQNKILIAIITIIAIIAIFLCVILFSQNNSTTEQHLRNLGQAHNQYSGESDYTPSDSNEFIESVDRKDSKSGQILIIEE